LTSAYIHRKEHSLFRLTYFKKKEENMREDGRSLTQLRSIRLTPNYLLHPAGSALVEWGNTMVLCSVSVERGVPSWMRNSRSTQGWLTAEYSMIPSSTNSRNKRERGFTSGRSQEIQRLIGRSLRSIMDLSKCPDMTFIVDCDVLQADGGTRTAAISASSLALRLAVNSLLRSGKLKQNPLLGNVAAVSVGIKNKDILVDLDYSEDYQADLDMNIVITDSGKIQEIQGCGEGRGFDSNQVPTLLNLASDALENVFELQNIAAENQVAEG
jgi:ribonuclease PH